MCLYIVNWCPLLHATLTKVLYVSFFYVLVIYGYSKILLDYSISPNSELLTL